MKKFLLAAVVLVSSTACASAELKTQTIDYKQGDAVLQGYLAYDDAFPGKRPGVLVFPEWWGLNDYPKMRADMLASLGYVAFAADIYGKGVRFDRPQDAGAESSKYKNDPALLRARAVAGLQVLQGRPNVDPDRIAAIGYCFGGMAALELARTGANLKGVVTFHGDLGTAHPEDAKNIKGEVLVLHGAADPFVSPEEVAAFEAAMKEAKAPYTLIKYPGAVHGFTNPANTGAIQGVLYDPAADQKSWDAMKTFLAGTLTKGGAVMEKSQ